jgi:ribosome maturation factor RimP
MGLEGTSLWKTVEQVALEEGVVLFDLELPSDTRRGGALKVFITRPVADGSNPQEREGERESAGNAEDGARGGISFEDCVRVSKRILDLDEQSELIPGNCTLEVSSPGINRKLRLPEHFKGAVGERVKVKFKNDESGATVVVNGYIRDASSDSVRVEAESGKESFQIPLRNLKEARVDFKF